ncbi:unnamed protein product, partial [Scytosiphon promiscuus]
MPRLGDDPNMATAYPNRASTNLRGSWMRQLAMTLLGTIIVYNLVFKDYKGATKAGMSEKGLADEIETIIPKTSAEKIREARVAKMTFVEKLENLHYEVGNLTLAVIEIQKLLVEANGATIEHTIKLAHEPEEDQAGDEAGVQGSGGGGSGEGGGGGDPPTVMLRGAEAGQEGAVVGNPDGGDIVEGGGDGGADGARRRLSSQGRAREGRPEETEAAAAHGG